jgi:hypothetical protein
LQIPGARRLAMMAMVACCLPWNATAVMGDRPSRLEAFMQGTPREVEQLLVKSLLEITQGRLDAALKDVDAVIREMPNFKLAYLIRGDLLQAKVRQINGFGSVPEANRDEIADLRQEAKVRLEHYLAPQGQPDIAADYLWQLDSSQQNAMVVDTAMVAPVPVSQRGWSATLYCGLLRDGGQERHRETEGRRQENAAGGLFHR